MAHLRLARLLKDLEPMEAFSSPLAPAPGCAIRICQPLGGGAARTGQHRLYARPLADRGIGSPAELFRGSAVRPEGNCPAALKKLREAVTPGQRFLAGQQRVRRSTQLVQSCNMSCTRSTANGAFAGGIGDESTFSKYWRVLGRHLLHL